MSDTSTTIIPPFRIEDAQPVHFCSSLLHLNTPKNFVLGAELLSEAKDQKCQTNKLETEQVMPTPEKKYKKKVSGFLLKKFQENHLKLGGILTTRFNAKTLMENRAFLEKINSTVDTSEDTSKNQNQNRDNGMACVYCAPASISEKIPIGSRCAVLEMDNDTNMIIGIGLIENKACKKKISVYEWGYYNRVNYVGYFRIDRKDMSQEELKTMAILDLKCFKGSGHLKRGKGLTMFPIAYLFDLFENGIDVETIIREMFNCRFLPSGSGS